jgi:ppGpp synthetase/RelA/SpoT-type nucleotidyltranferase
VDKVNRLSVANPNAQVGDLIDAVGARITIQNTNQLASVLQRVRHTFGTGDGGRIIEIENLYLHPKSKNLGYRVIPLCIVVEVNGLAYTFELQLTTVRASVAADLEHNTVFKNLVGATPAEQRAVLAAFDEAAALEQLETRGGS